jgi:hypothetical protein
MDVHIPLAVTEGLRRRGIDVLTSQLDGTTQATDEAILTRATELGRLLLSQDEDFLRIAAQKQSRSESFSGIIFAPQIGISIGLLVEEVELLACCATLEELANEVTHLPLK